MKVKILAVCLLFILPCFAIAQVVTEEDSLYSGILPPKPGESTILSGYGEAVYKRDFKRDSSSLNVPRVVTFFGHRFSNNILFFSAMEFRDIKVAGGEPGGEVALEQAFLKFNIDTLRYIQAGLFLPRVGMLNENHLPANYYSNDRPLVETTLIPGVWKEMGIGFYGGTASIKGFYYNISLLNGLNYRRLGENNTGIREAAVNGPRSANNLAVSGALLYYFGETLRLQTSFYYGGTVDLRKEVADTLGLKAGPFGTPAITNEANLQFRKSGWTVKVLGTRLALPDAGKINKANDYEHPVARVMTGGYIEAAYNLLYRRFRERTDKKGLILFARVESMDLNHKAAEGLPADAPLKQRNLIGGINYSPVPGVLLKLDYKYAKVGASYKSYAALGFGYSF